MPDKQQYRAAWIIGGSILLLIAALACAVFLFDRREYWWMLKPLLRFLMAVAAGVIASFIAGKVGLKGQIFGLKLDTTAGFALFILVLIFWDPFPVTLTPPVFEGDRLGDLEDSVRKAYAKNESRELIEFAIANSERLSNFRLSVPKVSGKDWLEVAQRICDLHSCLVCRVNSKARRVEIDFRTEPTECRTAGGKAFYRCAGVPCTP